MKTTILKKKIKKGLKLSIVYPKTTNNEESIKEIKKKKKIEKRT